MGKCDELAPCQMGEDPASGTLPRVAMETTQPRAPLTSKHWKLEQFMRTPLLDLEIRLNATAIALFPQPECKTGPCENIDYLAKKHFKFGFKSFLEEGLGMS
ncbi:hypothetical protein AVEN_21357-1 [Araneus ventricosus]|uniref:Uncharacterized protein n=1 Tax=Araneus ventricosus TaxID=182803 RepID=A0A4Y2SQK7_ARAVE|nr:hypothetical protein AVEN_21357-1 [Araneus ventricosus]